MEKVRVNLANPLELLEIPGIDRAKADAIVRFRAEHGPIRDAGELAKVLGDARVPEHVLARVDFDPADATAPEAPGA
jgi:DNA uptake protein ComE-like DNA-binding protein